MTAPVRDAAGNRVFHYSQTRAKPARQRKTPEADLQAAVVQYLAWALPPGVYRIRGATEGAKRRRAGALHSEGASALQGLARPDAVQPANAGGAVDRTEGAQGRDGPKGQADRRAGERSPPSCATMWPSANRSRTCATRSFAGASRRACALEQRPPLRRGRRRAGTMTDRRSRRKALGRFATRHWNHWSEMRRAAARYNATLVDAAVASQRFLTRTASTRCDGQGWPLVPTTTRLSDDDGISTSPRVERHAHR